ncbi:uncharacterized protein METZ01_LOCUS238212, partial [marine metagenome]
TGSLRTPNTNIAAWGSAVSTPLTSKDL